MSGPLNHPVAKITSQLLIDLGIGTDDPNEDWRVYLESEPDNPDNVITIYDTSNDPDDWVMITGMLLERYGIQIRVRSGIYTPGFNKVESIKNYFDQEVYRNTVTIDSIDYMIHSMDRSSGPFHIGTEENTQRDVFTINYLATLEKIQP